LFRDRTFEAFGTSLEPVAGVPEVLASLGDTVQFARRNIVTQTIHLVVGGPDCLVFRVDVDTSWVTHAHCIHFPAGAIERVQTDNATNTDFVVQVDLVFWLNVVWLTQGHIQFAVISNAAYAASVVV
jgi:hypothetical protein